MSLFELNKIAGALLAAALTAGVATTISNLVYPEPHVPEILLAVPASDGGPGPVCRRARGTGKRPDRRSAGSGRSRQGRTRGQEVPGLPHLWCRGAPPGRAQPLRSDQPAEGRNRGLPLLPGHGRPGRHVELRSPGRVPRGAPGVRTPAPPWPLPVSGTPTRAPLSSRGYGCKPTRRPRSRPLDDPRPCAPPCPACASAP